MTSGGARLDICNGELAMPKRRKISATGVFVFQPSLGFHLLMVRDGRFHALAIQEEQHRRYLNQSVTVTGELHGANLLVVENLEPVTQSGWRDRRS
jgi:hypothetical protein